MPNRDEWLGKYETLRGPMWRLFVSVVVFWTFFTQIRGLPVGRMVLTGMVSAALLVPLYRYPIRWQGTGAPTRTGGSGWVLPFASLCAAVAGTYLNWVLVPPRGPWTQLYLAAGLAGGLDFPVPFALAAMLLVTGLAFLVDLQSGRLLSDLGQRILAQAGIFAASSLGRLRRESRLREQNYLRELEAAHGRLQEVHAELQAAAERAVTLAALEERNRIARDLHDILGHTLTVLVVQLQAVKRLLPGQISRAVTQLDTLEELSRQGLAEVRQVVRTMAGGAAGEAGVIALKALVSEFAERTGIKGTFSVTGPAGLEAGLSSQFVPDFAGIPDQCQSPQRALLRGGAIDRRKGKGYPDRGKRRRAGGL